MTNYQAVATQAARQYGIPVNAFLKQIQIESGWDPNARSSAGALGIAQFMPATARGFHIDPMNPVQALFAAARYDRQGVDKYGSLARALSVYNSGKPDAYLDPHFAGGQTYNYVRQILGGQVPAPAAGNTAAAAAPNPSPPAAAAAPPPGLNLAALFNTGNRAVGLPTLNPAAFAAAVQQLAPHVQHGPPPPAPPAAAPGNWQKWVRLSPGADRRGATTSSAVLQFVGKVGAAYGKPLTIGTGTNHNQYVVGTNRQSDHWTGHAADIPSSGAALTRLGQTALIAAGMPAGQAAKATGGVYNVGRYQILFNTRVGGNHFNHLHVGVR